MYLLYKNSEPLVAKKYFYPIGMRLMKELDIKLKNGFVDVKGIIKKAEENGYKIKKRGEER